MKTVDKSQLTAQLLELLQLVELEGEEILAEVLNDRKRLPKLAGKCIIIEL